jgi:hypothetical protein
MKKRRSKSLEKVSRLLSDNDEFIEHVFGIAAAYRAQYELESSAKGAEVRKAIKTFDKHASALTEWLRLALKPGATAEHAALKQLSTALHGASQSASAQAQAAQLWLSSVLSVTERALLSLQRTPLQQAPLAAAEALRDTCKHHGIKISFRGSAGEPSDVVRLLCAIAKDAGDALHPEQARQLLKSKVAA